MKTIPAKMLLTKSGSEYWFDYDYTLNLYRGCSHGCIYCDSRSECYQIENFDEVCVKENIEILLNRELASKKQKGIIGMGAMSDPYNPFEATQQATKKALELINHYHFGVALATKSPLVLRDIELFKKISQHSSVIIKMTITTFDDEMARIIEPHVAPSSERFNALQKLSEEGIFCGILLTPVLPFIEDSVENIVAIVRKAAQCNVKFIYPQFGVTLRGNQKKYFFDKLDQNFPMIRQKYERVYRKDQYVCPSLNINELYQIFAEECEKANILYRMEDIIAAYKKKPAIVQESLF